MKKIGILIFMLAFLFISCESDNEVEKTPSTAEEMGEVLFKAIVKEDAATVKKYFATNADIEERLVKSNLSEKKKKAKKTKYEKRIVALENGIAKTLADIKGENVDWDNVSYDWIDYKNFEKDSVTGADITIVFSEGRKQFEIKLKECIPTKRGWVLFNKISFKGERK